MKIKKVIEMLKQITHLLYIDVSSNLKSWY